MTAEEAKILDHFFCETCSSKGQKKLQNSHAASRPSDTKVFPIPHPSIHFRVSPNSSAGMYYQLQTSPLIHYVSGGYKTTPEVTKRLGANTETNIRAIQIYKPCKFIIL
ncbi:hypothetical protein Goshw_027555, partial [Gossypium schwendimanii]|nr:hypothetical protein [Gossypium schwendimanii]MBA0875181.1 hypothetical protein [Gossypium schwendimanii]